MQSVNAVVRSSLALLASAGLLCACEGLLELDSFALQRDAAVTPLACSSDAACQSANGPAVCSVEHAQCVPVLNELCSDVTGELSNPTALRLGALLSLHGHEAATNLERLRAMQLAVEQINQTGGVPDARGGAHPLVLVSCDTGDDPVIAGRHLIEDLGVPAILGPNSSEDTLQLSTRLSIAKRTLTLSPTAMAGSLRDLADDDLSWSMVPTDTQRAPLLHAHIHELEAEAQAKRGSAEPTRLSIVYRDDAFGHGVRLSLSSLSLNGKSLTSPINMGRAVQFGMYDPELRDMPRLVAEQVAFKPDILLLAGSAEVVSTFLEPLEAQLEAASAPRPHYVLTDATKLPALLELAQRVPGLASRLHGVGLAPTDEQAFRAFQRDFRERFGADAAVAGVGVATAYDTVYAIAFAAAAAGGKLGAADLAKGLRAIEVDALADAPAELATAFGMLSAAAPEARRIAHGAYARFAWDERGVPRAGKLELWCVTGDGSGGFALEGSGPVFDVGEKLSAARLRERRACTVAETPVLTEQPELGAAAGQLDVGAAMQPSAAGPDAGVSADESDADAGAAEPEPDAPVLYAEYRSANADPVDTVIGPWLRIGNRGTGPGVPLKELELRYYVTNETNPLCLRGCVADLYWAGLLPDGTRVPAHVEYVVSGWLTGYLELSFMKDAPRLRPHEYVELQVQFHTADYQMLDETNDYSFDATHSEFKEFRRVAVYRDDALVWGELPAW
jgi:branched-chain amino acid transport system substrate-binding protein